MPVSAAVMGMSAGWVIWCQATARVKAKSPRPTQNPSERRIQGSSIVLVFFPLAITSPSRWKSWMKPQPKGPSQILQEGGQPQLGLTPGAVHELDGGLHHPQTRP